MTHTILKETESQPFFQIHPVSHCPPLRALDCPMLEMVLGKACHTGSLWVLLKESILWSAQSRICS